MWHRNNKSKKTKKQRKFNRKLNLKVCACVLVINGTIINHSFMFVVCQCFHGGLFESGGCRGAWPEPSPGRLYYTQMAPVAVCCAPVGCAFSRSTELYLSGFSCLFLVIVFRLWTSQPGLTKRFCSVVTEPEVPECVEPLEPSLSFLLLFITPESPRPSSRQTLF